MLRAPEPTIGSGGTQHGPPWRRGHCRPDRPTPEGIRDKQMQYESVRRNMGCVKGDARLHALATDERISSVPGTSRIRRR